VLMETQKQYFVGSPELVTAMAIAGDLGFNL
jgi:aconitase A